MSRRQELQWKVCGLREPTNMLAVAALKPDWVGFIFYRPSPRYVGEDFEMPKLPSSSQKVGVFVNESLTRITANVLRYDLQAVQLHGDETPEDCARLRSARLKVIKAVGVDEKFDFASIAPFRSAVDLFLFDTRTSLRGGSGRTFNWEILKNYNLDIPFLLSGGLTLHNLEAALAIEHPQMAGVDLNSGLEVSAGHKDIEKVKLAAEIINKHRQP